MSIRIGILDTLPPEYNIDGEQTDPQKFVDMFTTVNAPFSYEIYESTQGHLPIDLHECDAYLITGSSCSVFESYPWIAPLEVFVRSSYAASKPLVGVCFGHQLIAQALGGRVSRADDGWLLGLESFEIQASKPWMAGSQSEHSLYFINEDQVDVLPAGMELLASSDACRNAMYCADDKLLCIQGHPEQPLASMRLFTQHLLNDDLLDQATGTRAHRTMTAGKPDAVLVAAWIRDFLLAALPQ